MDAPHKLFIQMSGAPGSGKSTTARSLAQAINGVVINHDLIKAFFLENGLPYEQSSKLTYGLDWVLAEDILRQGRSVIVDSICNYEEVLKQGTALAHKYVECRVEDIDLLDQRLRARNGLRSQRTAVASPPVDADDKSQDYQAARALFQRWIDCPRPPAEKAIVIDATRSPEECLDQIMLQILPSIGRTDERVMADIH